MIQCEKCGKDFKYKYLLNKHENRKFTCNTIENIEENYEEKIKDIENEINIKTQLSMEKETICLFCNKPQSFKNNTYRHIKKYCKVKRELDNELNKLKEDKVELLNKQEIKIKDEEIKLRDEKIKELENKLKSKSNIHTTINNNNITVNNTQNNVVVINPFGKEDLSHLTIKDYKNILNGFFPGFINYIEKVHFDENVPQNHNITISNLKSKYLSIHDGYKWNTKIKNDIIDIFINKKHGQLVDKCEELGDSKQIDKSTINNFEEFCESFNDKEAQKSTKNNVLLMMYDNKDKIKLKKNSLKEESEDDIKPKKQVKYKNNNK